MKTRVKMTTKSLYLTKKTVEISELAVEYWKFLEWCEAYLKDCKMKDVEFYIWHARCTTAKHFIKELYENNKIELTEEGKKYICCSQKPAEYVYLPDEKIDAFDFREEIVKDEKSGKYSYPLTSEMRLLNMIFGEKKPKCQNCAFCISEGFPCQGKEKRICLKDKRQDIPYFDDEDDEGPCELYQAEKETDFTKDEDAAKKADCPIGNGDYNAESDNCIACKMCYKEACDKKASM